MSLLACAERANRDSSATLQEETENTPQHNSTTPTGGVERGATEGGRTHTQGGGEDRSDDSRGEERRGEERRGERRGEERRGEERRGEERRGEERREAWLILSDSSLEQMRPIMLKTHALYRSICSLCLFRFGKTNYRYTINKNKLLLNIKITDKPLFILYWAKY